MKSIFHKIKPQFYLTLAFFVLAHAAHFLMPQQVARVRNEEQQQDIALACALLEGNSFKDIWIWLLLLWGIKIISKKKSSQSSGLPIFDSYRGHETKGRSSKT